MDRFTVRLPHDLARRFDAAASGHGGRSSLLRRLIEASAAEAGSPENAVPVESRTGKLTLRLGLDDLIALEAEAARVGLPRTRWVVALVRRKLHGGPQLSPPDAAAFLEVQRDLRRIGVNLNQIARTLHMRARVDASGGEAERVLAFATEVRGGLADLRCALEGNRDYWSTGS